MAKLDTVTATGTSGKKYDFNVYATGTSFKEMPGVYTFLKKDDDGKYHALYIGYTSDLSTRFDNHHKEACAKKNGMNFIGIHSTDTEKIAIAVEKDLLAAYDTTCNEVNN